MSNTSRVLETGSNQITQHYGNGHTGVDLVKYKGQIDNIIAHSSGKIIFCQTGQVNNPNAKGNASYGNCVKILHDNGMYTLYAHLESVNVRINQRVNQGQVIGRMGNTGASYGSHLHFEVFNSNNARVNPEPYLDKDLDGKTGCTGTIIYQVFDGKWEQEVHKADGTPEGYAGNGKDFISGVRAKPEFGRIYIQSHIMNKGWLEEVSSANYKAGDTQDANSYSGIYGEPIDGIKFRCTEGFIDARALTRRGYLPWVRFYASQTDNYIGNFGEPILGIQMC